MGYDKSVSASKELKGVKISNGKITFDISGTSTYYNEGEYTYNEFYNSFDYEPGNTEAKEYTSHVTVSFVQPGTVQINLSNIINIAGNIRITTTILIIAPRASKVQIEPIISTCE